MKGLIMQLSWANVIAVVSGLAGIAGTVITPIYGSALATQVQAVLTALSGILVIIAGGHATSVVAHAAKLREQYRMAVLHGYLKPPNGA
jgi:uncharacterized membrane protein YfcA